MTEPDEAPDPTSPDRGAEPPGETAATRGKGYTAVIHVHGMGSQRRYEESSRIVDAIDRHLYRAHHQDGQSVGLLRDIKPKPEPDRSGSGKSYTYIRTTCLPPKSRKGDPVQTVRFYEAYWAPIMAGQKSAGRVARWILRQALRPIRTLTAPWREHHRLHRAALADLRERPKPPIPRDDRVWESVLKAYARFDSLEEKRSYPNGSFFEFLALVKTSDRLDEADRARALTVAVAWRRHYIATELRNALVLATIFLAILLVVGALLWAIQSALVWLGTLPSTFGRGSVFGDLIAGLVTPGWGSAAGLLVAGGAGLGVSRFLTDYMGDVEAWSTYEETDEKHKARAEVVSATCGLMTHVLTDPNCNRVVVLAHSLGTSVAHDALLGLRKLNQISTADNLMDGPVPLGKISHLITLASPVDKINYFFETYRSASHRYTRVVESLRGDIMTEPFAKNGKPHIHWINFWDEADIISGPLHSPTGRDSLLCQVDNVHVPRLFFPDPGAAHTAYFENRRVIATIFEAAFENRHSFLALPSIEGRGKDYASVRLGPGLPRGRYTWVLGMAAALPWLALLALILSFVGLATPALALGGVACGLIVALLLGMAAGKVIAPDTPL